MMILGQACTSCTRILHATHSPIPVLAVQRSHWVWEHNTMACCRKCQGMRKAEREKYLKVRLGGLRHTSWPLEGGYHGWRLAHCCLLMPPPKLHACVRACVCACLPACLPACSAAPPCHSPLWFRSGEGTLRRRRRCVSQWCQARETWGVHCGQQTEGSSRACSESLSQMLLVEPNSGRAFKLMAASCLQATPSCLQR